MLFSRGNLWARSSSSEPLLVSTSNGMPCAWVLSRLASDSKIASVFLRAEMSLASRCAFNWLRVAVSRLAGAADDGAVLDVGMPTGGRGRPAATSGAGGAGVTESGRGTLIVLAGNVASGPDPSAAGTGALGALSGLGTVVGADPGVTPTAPAAAASAFRRRVSMAFLSDLNVNSIHRFSSAIPRCFLASNLVPALGMVS